MLLFVASVVVIAAVVVAEIHGKCFCALNIGAEVVVSFAVQLKVHISVSDAYHRRTK